MDWEEIRKSFMIPDGTVYLNTGTAGPCPRCVLDKTVEWQRVFEANPAEMGGVISKAVTPARAGVAAFLGTSPESVVFVLNVTMGMNMIAGGIRSLKPGDEIVSTDQEYPAVQKIVDFFAEKRGCIVKRVAIPVPVRDSDQLFKAFEHAITGRTKLLQFAHITSHWAIVMPVQRLCRLARERGIITVIDGAHAPGMIPVDLSAMDCDFYAGNCHKWLCSPKGAGFVYAAPGVQHLLEPVLVGHGWVKDKETFRGNCESLGTHSPAAYIGAGEAVEFQNRIARENIAARGQELARHAQEALLQIPGIKPATPVGDPDFAASMKAYAMPPLDDDKRLGRILGSHGVTVPSGVGPQGGRLRMSTHICNSTGDVDIAIRAIREAYGM